MNEARFHRRVSELIDAGLPWQDAIAQTAYEDAHYKDPFVVMRDKALARTS